MSLNEFGTQAAVEFLQENFICFYSKATTKKCTNQYLNKTTTTTTF